MSDGKMVNWAGNYRYGAAGLHRPERVEEVQELVRGGRKVKVLGTGHAFNGIADTTGDLISLAHFDGVLALDRERRTVTVGGGIRYGKLCQVLDREGYGLANMASLPHLAVAGACATATHGSGDGNGCLATAVCGLEMVTAGGEVVAVSREQEGELFQGMVVNLGGLGVVTKLTLEIVPAYQMRQDVYENLPMAQLEGEFEAVFGSGYSVSLFTDWRGANFKQVWVKRRVAAGEVWQAEGEWLGARLATGQRHPVAGMAVENCTEQMGVSGRWYERLPHFRMGFTPSSGEELQSEYIVPRREALGALRAIGALGERVAALLQVSEVRTVAADGLWMSPFYGQDCVAIHFTWQKRWQAVKKLLPLIEERLAPYGVRPHWGKLFMMRPEKVQALYERLPEFRQLLRTYDPKGKFRNGFLDAYIFGG